MLRIISLIVIALMLVPVGAAAQSKPHPADSPIAELTAFFEQYSEDLRTHRREAIVARYDPEGGYRMGGGVKRFMKHSEVKSLYMEKWRGPKAFSFFEMTFEVIVRDWAIALGKFEWTPESGPVAKCSYTGVLRKNQGKWFIRVEDESCEGS